MAIAALFAIGLYVWTPQQTTLPEIEILAEVEEEEIPTKEPLREVDETMEDVIELVKERPTRTIHITPQPIEESHIAQADTTPEPTKERMIAQNEVQTEQRHQYNYSIGNEVDPPHRTHKRSTELSLLYAGGVGSPASTLATTSRQMAISNALSSSGSAEISLYDIYDSSDISHHQPFSVGLRIQHELTSRLLLSSGVSYSRLSSDVTLNKSGNTSKQHIHFVGVPISLKYRFMSHDRLSLYGGGGGGVERCVGAKVGSTSVDEREWHYSAGINLGAEYRLNSWAGLYLEPSLSHYFTQTHLQSIRNNSPTTFSLHIGVSFTL